MKIISDDKIPFLKGILEPFAEVIYLPGSKTTPEIVADADAIITRTRTKCNQSLLENSKVKFIGTATIGFDHIDTNWVERNGITWTNSPGCNSGSVKQYIAAALAQLSQEKGIKLEGKNIGIVGVGNVGSKIAIVAQAFGMKVLLNDPPRQRNEGGNFVSLEKIVTESDLITFHVPLIKTGIDKTLHLLNNQLIEKMKKGVIIINSSRGEVTKTESLLEGLKKGIISEAIIDVWENEPEINIELLKNSFIATPHIAGYSLDGKANGTSMVIQALSKKFNLPLKNWYPNNIPIPPDYNLFLNCKQLTNEQAISKIILHTYPIRRDDNTLRNSIKTFETQRGNYPLRREFGVYQLNLNNASDSLITKLKHIGFNQIKNTPSD
ncbi:MAG: 4-phosphoerythronate dehydrogenase PdxB [Marinilabiliaceae bacterium]|nr:4-phosphoerythronate dehydrogenase PdxB [Marinilabiliaceae bacterium]